MCNFTKQTRLLYLSLFVGYCWTVKQLMEWHRLYTHLAEGTNNSTIEIGKSKLLYDIIHQCMVDFLTVTTGSIQLELLSVVIQFELMILLLGNHIESLCHR